MSPKSRPTHVASPTDESMVRALYAQLIAGWNTRSRTMFAAQFTEDGYLVGFDGTQMNGRAQIETNIRRIFADHLTAAYVWKIKDVLSLTPQVAMLRAVVGMVGPGEADLNPDVNAIQTLVAVKRNRQWRIALLQNTPARFDGRPDLTQALTKELRQLL